MTVAIKFKITDTKLYVLVVTLSIPDNEKLLQQLKSGFKRSINWNKHQPKVSLERQNQYLEFLTLRRQMPQICGFLGCLSFSHFLTTCCCF